MNRLMLTLAMVGWTMAALSSAEPDPRADDRMAIRKAAVRMSKRSTERMRKH